MIESDSVNSVDYDKNIGSMDFETYSLDSSGVQEVYAGG
jgi:hypothetical protein